AALHERRERARDRGLAGAGRSEQEDRTTAVDRGAELTERVLGEHEVPERLAEVLHRDLHVAQRLGTHATDVRGERDRRGADVAVPRERLARAFGALGRKDVDVRRCGDAGPALHLDEVLVLEEVEDGRADLGERETHRVGQLLRRRLTLLVQQLQREVGDERRGEAGLLEGRRRHWRGRLRRLRRPLVLDRRAGFRRRCGCSRHRYRHVPYSRPEALVAYFTCRTAPLYPRPRG